MSVMSESKCSVVKLVLQVMLICTAVGKLLYSMKAQIHLRTSDQ